eukprot:EG_transcript_30856
MRRLAAILCDLFRPAEVAVCRNIRFTNKNNKSPFSFDYPSPTKYIHLSIHVPSPIQLIGTSTEKMAEVLIYLHRCHLDVLKVVGDVQAPLQALHSSADQVFP